MALGGVCPTVANMLEIGLVVRKCSGLDREVIQRHQIVAILVQAINGARILGTAFRRPATARIGAIEILAGLSSCRSARSSEPAPRMALKIIDQVIHAFGAASDEAGLARDYASTRTMRLADGPEEVHCRAIARLNFTIGPVK